MLRKGRTVELQHIFKQNFMSVIDKMLEAGDADNKTRV